MLNLWNSWNLLISKSLDLLSSRRNLLNWSREDSRIRVNHSGGAAAIAACSGGGGGVVALLGWRLSNSFLKLQLRVLKNT